ncbi:two-component system chemotaxis response regulator CheB [Geodermatophilus tzadiensis]|uniref:protein-glutamate methylesterase n=1 Tax=Geodermatophilus tzadiensis TaxID=1137988 RepID=A0A2T0TWE3_9ACTN|nr:chemotaxis protein CheB [Geodermatophilus tzadiensis]PRY49973.1 two-component system chemotaxis response regulator CheB [Geodermatophilus tzadiensis]
MATRDLVVVGASAGGVEALRELCACLPEDLPAAVLVALHMPASGRSALASVLGRVSRLPVRAAEDGLPLVPGTVTVAVPDRHLLVVGDRVLLSRGPRENGHRPAVDVLFRSAAQARGPRVVGVVLSGALDDGTAGTIAIRSRGGVAVAQDPADALYPSMPLHAAEVGRADHVAAVADLPELLDRLVRQEVDAAVAPPPTTLMDTETEMAQLDAHAMDDADRPGSPSGFGCPTCHGALFTIAEGGMERFRCRVGHAWSPAALAAEQAQALEGALWMALRGLEERAALSRRMGDRAAERGHRHSAKTFRRRHDEAHQAAGVLRELLERGVLHGDAVPEDVDDTLGDPGTERAAGS